MTIQGTESDINAALDGMTFTPASGYNGIATIDLTTSLGADLQGFYEFEGNANDSSVGVSQDGTLIGGASTAYDATRNSDVLLLDSASESVFVNDRFSEPTDVTLAAWINLDTGRENAEIISLGNNIVLRADDTTEGLALLYYQGGAWTTVSAANVDLDGTGWNHVAATFDDTGNHVAIYLNGEEVAGLSTTDSIDWSVDANTTNYTTFGVHGNGSNLFDFQGQMDDVRIYNRALSAGEISAIAGNATQVSDSITITVNPANDAPTFNTTLGYTTTVITGSSSAYAEGASIDADGRTLVIGRSDTGLAVSRFNEDGSLDTSFSSGGTLDTDFGLSGVEGIDIAIQPDGKIVVTGSFDNGTDRDFLVARLNEDGSTDTSFDADGLKTIDILGDDDSTPKVIVQTDGKLVVAGSAVTGSFEHFAFVRLNADGSFDNTFDADGIRSFSIATGLHAIDALASQTDGKLIFVGRANGNTNSFTVGRLETDGSLDTTFNGIGYVQTNFGTGTGGATDVALQPDGMIVVTGYENAQLVLARYTNTGVLDTGFGSGAGFVTSNLNGVSGGEKLALQSDGKIVVAGDGTSSSESVIRFNADGSVDTTFGITGAVALTTPDSLESPEIYGVDVTGNGEILISGGLGDRFFAERINSDGSSDSTFGYSSVDTNPLFVEDGTAIVLDSDVQVSDAELDALNGGSGNYNDASVTLAREGGANTDDVFNWNTGTVSGITLSGTNLLKSGQSIATFDTTTTVGELVISFTDANTLIPTTADVATILSNITYANSSNGPPASVQIDWTFDDGNTGAQGTGGAQVDTGTTTVDITPVSNDPITDAHYTQYLGSSEFIVNTETSNSQDNPGVASLSGGGFVVVWESYDQDGDGDSVHAQRYNDAGTAVGPEIQVNTETSEGQGNPSVAALTDGGFIVVWASDLQDSDNYGVYAQRFDSGGGTVGTEFRVNTTTADFQGDPHVTGLTSGGFVVVWESNLQDGDAKGIYQQVYDAAGATVGTEARVNTTTSGGQFDAAVVARSDGGYVVLWDDNSTGDNDVDGQRFDATGSKVGSEFQINTTKSNWQENAAIVALSGGGFVVVWESGSQDGDGEGVFGQLLADDLSAVGVEFQVNTTTADNQEHPQVVALPSGGFTVVWESDNQDGDGDGIYAQQFDATATPINGEFQVNTSTTEDQTEVEITALSNGRLVAIWEDDTVDGDSNAVVGRIFTPALNENSPVGTVAAVASQVVDPDSNDVYTYNLLDDASGAFDINPVNGDITVLDPALLDFETLPSLNVVVRITDPVTGPFDETVTIHLHNLAEAEVSTPAGQSMAEDGTLTFSGVTAPRVSDTLDETDNRMQVSISVNDGVVNLSQLTGITIVEGALNSGSVTINGIESDLNAALDGLTFIPDEHFSGSAILNITSALAAELEGHYLFTGGSARDSSDGTVQNGVLNGNATTIVDGIRGEVLSLDGNGDFVQINGLFDEPADLTLAAWINATGTDTLGANVISLGGSPALYLEADGTLTGYYNSGITDFVFTTTDSLQGTGWRHVALTIDTTTQELMLYLDGKAVGIITANLPIEYDNGPDTYIGRAGDGLPGFDFDGTIDDARIYSRALSSDEIATLATNQAEATDTVAITVNPVNDAPTYDMPGELIFLDGDNGYGQNRGMHVLTDGSMLLTPYDSGGDSVLLKLNADGSIDTSFGIGGYADNSSIGYIHNVTEQPDGKILVTGSLSGDLYLARYNANGTIDFTFATGGVTTLLGTGFNTGTDISVQSDGRIVVVGDFGNDSIIARYTSTGIPDSGFGSGGSVVVNLGSTFESLESVATLADGSIIAEGETSIVKLDTNGAFDTGFDGDGILDVGNRLYGTAVQADGKFLVTGGTGSALFVNRYHSDGSLDTDFGTGGTAAWSFTSATGYSIAQQADGKLVVAGFTDTYPTQWVAVRLHTDGSLDTDFASGGAWIQDTSTDYSEAYAASVYNDGTSEKIVIGGYTTRDSFDSNTWLSVVRLNQNGSLDHSISTNTLDGNPTYLENRSPVLMDEDVQIHDVELSEADNFNNAFVWLHRSGGGNTEDVFGASGNLDPLAQGAAIMLSGVDIGTVSSTAGGNLILTFNANATQARVDETLQSLTYANNSDNPPASVNIDWDFYDGNSSSAQGSGGQLVGTGTIQVDIESAPDLATTVPPAATSDEDTIFVYSGANIIQVDDGIASDAPLQIEMSVTNGVLNLAGTTGISFVEGADGSNRMVIEGLQSDLNAALDGLFYTPLADYNGADTLTMRTSVEAGLEGHYTFTGGTANDESAGTPYNGTFTGNATTLTDGTRGEVLTLDGTDDAVQISNTYTNAANMSLAAWVNLSSADVNGAEVISLGDNMVLRVDDSVLGGLVGHYYDGSSWIDLTATGVSVAGNGWNHVAYVLDDTNNTHTLYLNGVSIASASTTGSIAYVNGTDTFIGSHGNADPTYYFNGLIDDARVYSRALSAEEISALATDSTEVTDNVAITVDPINDPPGIAANTGVHTNIGGTVTIS
ncbi:MAG: LamG-like jellyroll fold domain-containing protein, partial [Pseudomonadota bacterium]